MYGEESLFILFLERIKNLMKYGANSHGVLKRCYELLNINYL